MDLQRQQRVQTHAHSKTGSQERQNNDADIFSNLSVQVAFS